MKYTFKELTNISKLQEMTDELYTWDIDHIDHIDQMKQGVKLLKHSSLNFLNCAVPLIANSIYSQLFV